MDSLDRRRRTKAQGLVPALQNLTDGFTKLVRQHLELVRFELKQEASDTGKKVAALAVLGSIALVGYLMLNLAAVGFAAWFGGIVAVAITSLILALLNLGVSLGGMMYVGQRLQSEAPEHLDHIRDEFNRDKKWLQEIRDNSKEHKALESSSSETRTSPPK